jgi:hypothetical protein
MFEPSGVRVVFDVIQQVDKKVDVEAFESGESR